MRGAQVNAEALRSLRVNLGLTQEQLASRAEIDVTTLRRMEKGLKAFDIPTISAVAASLGCHVSRLVIPSPSTHAADSPEEINRACVARHREGFARKDVEAVLACYTEDAVVNFPTSLPPPSGRFEGHAAIRGHLEETFRTFTPEIPTLEESVLYVFEDRVILRQVSSAVVLQTGASFTSELLFEYYFRDGKIWKHVGLFDTAAMANALNTPPIATPDSPR
jgi:ketosteroid isomerase-like protein